MTFLVDLFAATLRNSTPLVYGAVGETYAERSGVLNLGIEGTMYAGAFSGFAVAYSTGSLLLGLVAAIVVGLVAGGLMAFLTVTLGANQHVSGIGLTILLIGLSEFFNRLMFGGTELQRIDPSPSSRRQWSSVLWLPCSANMGSRGSRSSWSFRGPGGCSTDPRSASTCGPSAKTRRPPMPPASAWHGLATRR